MKSLRIGLFVLLCAAGQTFAQRVVYNFDRSTKFSGLHTYKWITIEGNEAVSQITSQNITNLVNTQLADKGFVQAAGSQKADMYVGFQVSIDQQKQLNWFNNGGYWMGGGMGWAATTTIDVGTLVVDFYNPSQKQLIWRGTATKTLNPSGNANKNYEHLQKAVAKLLKDFPPPFKK
jgi:hypothetical protein